MTGPRVYVSGPMTGLPGHNYPAFRAAAEELTARGWDVIDPSRYTPGMEWTDYLRRGIADILTASHVATLPGWTNSTGAILEVRVALALKLPCEPIDNYL